MNATPRIESRCTRNGVNGAARRYMPQTGFGCFRCMYSFKFRRTDLCWRAS